MSVDFEKVITEKSEQTRTKFRALLDKTNKENPQPKDVKALSDLLSGNRKLERWRDAASAGHLAELMVIENAHATAALKECWKHRLQVLKKDLGYDGAPILEQLLIQQAALCWLKLNFVELSYSNTMKQSITLTLGVYWEKRLSAAQRRFTRAARHLRGSDLSQQPIIAIQYCRQSRAASERYEVMLTFLPHRNTLPPPCY